MSFLWLLTFPNGVILVDCYHDLKVDFSSMSLASEPLEPFLCNRVSVIVE